MRVLPVYSLKFHPHLKEILGWRRWLLGEKDPVNILKSTVGPDLSGHVSQNALAQDIIKGQDSASERLQCFIAQFQMHYDILCCYFF